ncbi:MAG: PD-(D/E)XK nuclease domain-containing protein, partial [Microscillaceae bacterium]|nr:PD-(D/E)XK nuclease domain-containing protein [Microscillaceae bacterium]
EYFAWLITERENLPYNEDKIREGVRAMLRGNIQPFMKMVEDVLNILSNRDYQNFDEKYIKVLIIAYIIQTNTYYTPSERETPAGYIDLLFIAPTDKKTDYEYIFELKYLKKSDASEQKIIQAKQEAKTQILQYVQADPTLRNRKSLYAFTLVFVKNKLLIDPVEL